MKRRKREQRMQQALSAVEALTNWVGSVSSLLIHTLLFTLSFTIGLVGLVSWDMVLLILTTIVSLEAIYLAIFIQMTVNSHTKSLREVEEDIEEISEDIEELEEDIDEILEDDDRDAERRLKQSVTLTQITKDLQKLLDDVENLKNSRGG